MAFKFIPAVLVTCAMLSGGARAESYQPGDFLMLDLQQAVLSPKPLGPAASFERVQIEARSDTKAAPVKAAPKMARAAAKPAVRIKQARRSNPLDANASDTRIQTWPCRSGPMCNWQR